MGHDGCGGAAAHARGVRAGGRRRRRSGAGCDGQVLVFHDLFNYTNKEPNETPKHARVYCDLHKLIDKGFREYVADVKSGAFPSAAESFAPKPVRS